MTSVSTVQRHEAATVGTPTSQRCPDRLRAPRFRQWRGPQHPLHAADAPPLLTNRVHARQPSGGAFARESDAIRIDTAAQQ
jgi:hypothetical protein